MNRRSVLLSLALSAALLSCAGKGGAGAKAPAIPDHPSKLVYPRFEFVPPSAADHRVELPRGCVAYLVPSDELPLVVFKAWFREPGLGADRAELGAQALLAGQMRRGGTASLSPAELDDALEGDAVSVGLSIGERFSTLSADALSDRFAKVLPLLEEMAHSPRVDSARLEVDRAAALQSVAHRYDKPGAVSRDLKNAVLHGFSQPALWSAESADVAGATREAILALARNRFSPDSAVFAVSGSFDRAEMTALLSKLVESWPAAKERRPELPETAVRENPGVHYVDYPSEQVHVHMAQPFVKRPHPDYYAASIASYVLGGGGFTSRLTSAVRVREGLAYSVYSYAGSSYFSRSSAGVVLQTSAPNAGRAVSIVFSEIRRLADEGPTPEEMSLAVEGLVNSLPSLFDSPAATAEALAANELDGRSLDHYALYPGELRKVTAEDVKRVVKLYFSPEKMAVTVVGPESAVLPSLRRELPGLPEKRWTVENLRSKTEP